MLFNPADTPQQSGPWPAKLGSAASLNAWPPTLLLHFSWLTAGVGEYRREYYTKGSVPGDYETLPMAM